MPASMHTGPRHFSLACSVSLALSLPAMALQPLVTDDTSTHGPGNHQIELAYGRQISSTDGVAGKAVTRSVPVVLTRGVTEGLDLYVSSTRQQVHTDDGAGSVATDQGWSPLNLGAKWRFVDDEDAGLSLAVKPDIHLAVSDELERRGLGTGRMSWGVALLATQATGFGELHVNLAYNRVNYQLPENRAATRAGQWRLSAAPVWELSEAFKLALDIGIQTQPDVTQTARMGYVEAGLVYTPRSGLELAFGLLRNNRDGDAVTRQALLGLSWHFR